MKNNILPTSMMVFMLFAYVNSYVDKKAESEVITPDLSGQYLGQEAPSEDPLLFAPDFISTSAYEYGGSFTPDGNEFYFSRKGKSRMSEKKIYQTRLVDGQWTKPEPVSFSDKHSQSNPYISPDGQQLYFLSDRLRPNKFSRKGDFWMVERNGEKWERPEYVQNIINDYFARSMSETNEGNLYFSGYQDGNYGVYRSELVEGTYQEPELLPLEINYLKGVAHPFIAPDESYLLFDAQTNGLGKTDIYVSFRNEDGTWTEAERLGTEINTSNTEKHPSISPDGDYLFFVRKGDIYWVSAATVKKLKGQVS